MCEKQTWQAYVVRTVKKALFGTSLLFWQMLSKKLVEWGFKLNEYDPCVTNKMINGKLCTIIWHVNDLKISRVKKKVVEDIIRDLNKTFRQENMLTTTQGKVFECLGMTLVYPTKGK